MKVYITGGTGFVGRALLRELAARDVPLRLLVRPGRAPRPEGGSPPAEVHVGDPLDPETHARAAEGCDAAVNLVGIVREDLFRKGRFFLAHGCVVEALLTGLKDAGVPRLVHMSALGVRADAASAYHRSKWGSERLVRYSGLSWTLLRPSLLLGAEGGFFRMLDTWARRPFAPLPGDGSFLSQPLAVEYAAKALADAALCPDARFEGKTYEAGGGEDVTYRGLLETVARARGRRPPCFLPIPTGLLRTGALFLDWCPAFPVTRDQLTMMGEGNVPRDPEPFFRDFGIPRTPVERLVDHCVNGTPL